MNDILKQRLVGALILLALGVVFWPIIFVEPGEQVVSGQPRIPPRPAVDVSPIEPPDQAGLRASRPVAAHKEKERELEPAEPAAEPVPAKPAAASKKTPSGGSNSEKIARTRSEAPERPVIDADGLPVAWILQVASVSSAVKANELRDRLLAMDQKAYVKKIDRGNKDLYRVYIGPKFEKAQLEKTRGQVDAEFGVKSMITRYVP